MRAASRSCWFSTQAAFSSVTLTPNKIYWKHANCNTKDKSYEIELTGLDKKLKIMSNEIVACSFIWALIIELVKWSHKFSCQSLG